MPSREVETVEYSAMMLRMVRAYGRRVAEADDVDLGDMARIADELEAAMQAAVDGMRARGKSWAYIGQGLGITRQAAQQRFSRASGVFKSVDTSLCERAGRHLYLHPNHDVDHCLPELRIAAREHHRAVSS